jgi:glycosyltransferase involved in cell wall biosynthesis
MWASLALEPPVGGDKVNEVERVRALSKKFMVYAFFLISLRNLSKRRTYLTGWFKDVGPIVTVLPWLNVYGGRLLTSLAAGTVVALTLVLLKLGRGVDLVISRGGCVANLPVVLVSKLIGVRVIFNVLSVPFEHTETMVMFPGNRTQASITAHFVKLLDYFVLRVADWTAVASEAAAQELTTVFGKDFRERIVFLRFPVADDYFNNYPAQLQAKRSISLLYYGSISGLYDFSQLIKALQEMNIRGEGASLTIYASRVARAKLGRFGSAPFLTLKDEVPREGVIQALRQCSAVVIPHSSEVKGVSLKAIEAMAIGVPVIIANPRELKIFRDGETCIVVSDNTPKGWAEAIMRTIAPECRERVVREARAEAENFRHSQNLKIISEILNRRGA